MTRYYHHVSQDDLLQATRALLKFCRDHEYPEDGLARLAACVAALGSGDFRTAVAHFSAIPIGGMGCLNDWIPPVVYEHEDNDYVCAVFNALLERSCRLMRTAAGDFDIAAPSIRPHRSATKWASGVFIAVLVTCVATSFVVSMQLPLPVATIGYVMAIAFALLLGWKTAHRSRRLFERSKDVR